LEIYGINKKEWQPILFSYIDKSQLPQEVGGQDLLMEYEEI
jgi:hypothetical protein